MMRLHSILPGKAIWLPFLPIRLGFLMWPLNPAAATTGISIMQRVGRTDSDLCQWPGILSGVGEKGAGVIPRRCSKYSGRRKTLAWSSALQLVLASGC